MALGLAVVDCSWLGLFSRLVNLLLSWDIEAFDLNTSEIFSFGEVLFVA